MLFSIRTRTSTLFLLAFAAAPLAAAPAPVSSLSASSESGSIARLERLLEARNRMQLDMQNQLQQMSAELDELRGIVEKNSFDLSQLVDRQRDIYKEIDTVRNQTALSSTDTHSSAEEPNAVDYSQDKSENIEYDKAVNLILKEKNFQAAIHAFDSFLKKYPNSIYRPNAHYWLGQLYFSMSEFEFAKSHFTSVSQFDESSKRADAILKLGLIAEKQGHESEARKKFHQVIKQFPDSTSSNQAVKKLKNYN